MKIRELLEYNLSDRQKTNALNNKATIIVKMPPQMFLSLTVKDSDMHYIKDKAKSKEQYQQWIDQNEIDVHPFLAVDEKSGKIVGHEGRSRAHAAIIAGDNEYECAVEITPRSRQLSIKDIPEIWTGQYNPSYKINFKQLVANGTIEVLNDNVQKQYQRVNESTAEEVFYHGSTNTFKNFDVKYLGKRTDDGIWGSGFYFTNHQPTAKNYGGKLYQVNLQIKNPLDLTKFTSKEELADYLDISEDILSQRDRAIGCLLPYSRTFSSAIKEKGHDGVIIDYHGHKEIVVFLPEQIKIIHMSESVESKKLNEDIWDGKNCPKAWFDAVKNQLYMVPSDIHHTKFLIDKVQPSLFKAIVGKPQEAFKNHDIRYDADLTKPFLNDEWVRLGYDHDGRFPQFYAEGNDFLVMAKALKSFYNHLVKSGIDPKPVAYVSNSQNHSHEYLENDEFYQYLKNGAIPKKYAGINEAFVFDANGRMIDDDFNDNEIHGRCTNLTLKAFGICTNEVVQTQFGIMKHLKDAGYKVINLDQLKNAYESMKKGGETYGKYTMRTLETPAQKNPLRYYNWKMIGPILDALQSRMSVASFMKRFPRYNFVIGTRGHSMAVKNGKLYDYEAKGPNKRLVVLADLVLTQEEYQEFLQDHPTFETSKDDDV